MCIHWWNNYSHHRYYNAWNKLDYRIWPKVIKETTQQSRQLSSRKQIFLTEGQINNRKILPPVQDAQCTSNNKGCKGLCSCPIINPFNDENGHDRRESNRHLDKQARMSALEIFKIKKEGATPRVWGLYTVYMSWHQAREYIHNWRDDDVNIMMLRSRKDSQAIFPKPTPTAVTPAKKSVQLPSSPCQLPAGSTWVGKIRWTLWASTARR